MIIKAKSFVGIFVQYQIFNKNSNLTSYLKSRYLASHSLIYFAQTIVYNVEIKSKNDNGAFLRRWLIFIARVPRAYPNEKHKRVISNLTKPSGDYKK